MAASFLALRTAWPGFLAWQPQATTYTPADAAGQSLVLELDHPSLVRLSIAIADPEGARPSMLRAQIAVNPLSPAVYDNLLVRSDRALGEIQIPLDDLNARRG